MTLNGYETGTECTIINAAPIIIGEIFTPIVPERSQKARELRELLKECVQNKNLALLRESHLMALLDGKDPELSGLAESIEWVMLDIERGKCTEDGFWSALNQLTAEPTLKWVTPPTILQPGEWKA